MNKIVVIGSSNTDMVVRSPKMPLPGETILGGKFDIISGGKGANQAVAAARAGGEVTFISKVGNDNFGKQAITAYQKDNIDTTHIFTDNDTPSGVAIIIVDATSGENSIVVAPGANAKLTAKDIRSVAKEIQSADVVLIQLEIPLEAVYEAMKIANNAGVTTILNPAPAIALNDKILALVDIITPNETEACLLTGIDTNEKTGIVDAATKLAQKVNKSVLITLGSEGVYYQAKRKANKFIPTSKVDAIDTTAAGDTFNGYLAAGIAQGKSMPEAIELANKAAAISVTIKGAQPSIPQLKDIVII